MDDRDVCDMGNMGNMGSGLRIVATAILGVIGGLVVYLAVAIAIWKLWPWR